MSAKRKFPQTPQPKASKGFERLRKASKGFERLRKAPSFERLRKASKDFERLRKPSKGFESLRKASKVNITKVVIAMERILRSLTRLALRREEFDPATVIEVSTRGTLRSDTW